MKITAISDLHGLLPVIEPSDILFICGDISPLKIQHNIPAMEEWLYNDFYNWAKAAPVNKIYLIAGNHDFYFERVSDEKINEFKFKFRDFLEYLRDEVTYYYDENGKQYDIYGTPYCKMFGNWAFMRNNDYLTEKFEMIPEDIDFILSHDTPYKVGQQDLILETVRWSNHNLEHVGNIPLRNRLEEVKYKYLFHGHIHSSLHEFEDFGTGKVVNCSLVNERYDEYYKPIILEV